MAHSGSFTLNFLHSLQGLEKYVMTKLFSRTFSSSPGDTKMDLEISEKIQLLQTFLKPQHLDIPSVLRNDASWLVCMLHRIFVYSIHYYLLKMNEYLFKAECLNIRPHFPHYFQSKAMKIPNKFGWSKQLNILLEFPAGGERIAENQCI